MTYAATLEVAITQILRKLRGEKITHVDIFWGYGQFTIKPRPHLGYEIEEMNP